MQEEYSNKWPESALEMSSTMLACLKHGHTKKTDFEDHEIPILVDLQLRLLLLKAGCIEMLEKRGAKSSRLLKLA